MIELTKDMLVESKHKSSKGIQFKWQMDGTWYKADASGYESLSEYVISKLLKKSSLEQSEYVDYQLDQAIYNANIINCCKSKSFLTENEQLITLERLFQTYYGESLTNMLGSINTVADRIKFVTNSVIELTGIKEFGEYLSKVLIIDGLFLNEDRHMHNIAVIGCENGTFRVCPIFDNGAALLSDTKIDYPLNMDLRELIGNVTSSTFDTDFEKQMDVAEKLFGLNISFSFDDSDIIEIINSTTNYSQEIKNRVIRCLIYQRNKYTYYFD